MTVFYAHSSPLGKPLPDGWQLLRDHLAGVARRAKELADLTGVAQLSPAAEAAGWLHDVGKYRSEFQAFIRGLPPRGSKQHKEAGAAWAARAGALPIALAVLGHHHGVPDKDDASKAVKGPDGIGVIRTIEPVGMSECPELGALQLAKMPNTSHTTDLFARLLLSCLVDADWADTGEHERQVRGWPKFPVAPPLSPSTRLEALLSFIDQRAATTKRDSPRLAFIRTQVLDACLTAAELPSGMFSLTVPTGGGKTLSSLAFALKHAATHDLRRVIYVAPFISILDQNADVIRAALGVASDDLSVFEHQSLAGLNWPTAGDEKRASAEARSAENWDAPIIVTTNVQFFESLFSNRPGRCRKLHNIARSVIILDECQTLPPDLVKPTCQMLRQLTSGIGCTVVLCTATQPAFDHECLGGDNDDCRLKAKEIIPPKLNLFAELKRVHIRWPDRGEQEEWAGVAARMLASPAALCIVNTKKAARDLFATLKGSPNPVYHLSTNMCPAHRMDVLAKVKELLAAQRPVYVVSTQLVEAGVDLDFPCVFREMAPLESIIQAAGRCNREGLLPNAGGQVVVFRHSEGCIPSGWYTLGRDVLEVEFLAAGRPPRIDDATDIQDYFGHLYWKRSLDPKNVVGMRAGLQFESVAEAYRLIADNTASVVVATWKEHSREIERLLTAVREKPVRSNFRALARFQVNVSYAELARVPVGVATPLSADIDVLVWRGEYDPQIGRVSGYQNLTEAI